MQDIRGYVFGHNDTQSGGGMSAVWVAVGILAFGVLLIIRQRRIGELRPSGQALPASEDCHLCAQGLLEAIPCPVFYKGLDGRYLGCNSAFAECLGRHRDEIVGRTVHDVAPRELAERHAAADAALFARTGTQVYDAKVPCADGSLRDVVLHKTTFAGADQAVAGIFGVISDLTEHARADRIRQQSEQKFRTLAENLADHIACYDRDGRCVYLNRRLAELLGVEAPAPPKALLSDPGYRDCLATVLETGQPAEIEVVFLDAAKGSRRHNVRFVAELGRQGEIVGALAIGRDVTERRHIQRQLEIHTAALNTSNDAVFLLDHSLRFVFVNETACRSLGYSREELLTMGPSDIDPDATPEMVRAMLNAMESRGDTPRFETRHRARDGRIYPAEIGCTLFEHEGKTYGLSVVRDITERKRMEDALRFVAQRAWQEGGKSFFEVLVRNLGQTLGVDYAMVAKLRETQDSVETVALFDRGAVVRNIRYDLAGSPCDTVMGQSYCCYPRGVQQWFPEDRLLVEMAAESYAGIPLWDSRGQPLGLIAVLGRKPLQDEAWVAQLLQVVAPRAAAELERARSDALLRAREYEFRSLAENAPDNIVRFDRQGRVLYINPRLEKTLEVAAADAVGKMPQEIVPTWDMASVKAVLETGESVEIEFAAPDRRCTVRQYQIRLAAERGPQGDIVGVLAIGRDVTRRKRAERDLLVLRSAINNATDGIFLVNEQLRFTYVNDRACSALGYGRNELLMMSPIDIVTEAARDDVVRIRDSLFASGLVIRMETEARTADGRAIFVDVTVSQVEYEHERTGLVVARDITGRKRMEDTLRYREEEFRSLAENLPDIVMRYDLDCRHIYANPAYMREVEVPECEVLGVVPEARHWRSSSLSLEVYKARLLQVMRTGESAELMMDWTRRSDGVAARYAMRVVAEHAADGRVIGALCIGRNVIKLVESERRLEASRRQLRDLAARREDAREEERRHIAREIHDELGQQLSALRFKLGLLAYDFGGAEPEMKAAVDNLMSLVAKAIQTTREVSSALRPAVLDMGIIPALEWLVAEYAPHGGVSFDSTAKPEDVRMNDACTVALFRVVQESLTNAVRHSKAERIEVVFGREADAHVVEVRDSGVGFDPDAPRDRRSVGLVGMHERALAVGGELAVFSAPGRGTVLRVRIPAGADQEEGS